MALNGFSSSERSKQGFASFPGHQRQQVGAHFLHRLALDLANTLGRNAEFRSQIVQRRRFFAQPAGLDNAAVPLIEVAQRGLQTFALQVVARVATLTMRQFFSTYS